MSKLKVTFQIQELLDDGQTPDVNGRSIAFGDCISHTNIDDFFYRAGLAAKTIYGSGGPCVVSIMPSGKWLQKIPAIKLIREFARVGLKEAKDAIERSDGLIMICPDEASAGHVATKLQVYALDKIIVSPAASAVGEFMSPLIPRLGEDQARALCGRSG